MKRIIALICLWSFSLSSMASTFEPLSSTFFLRKNAGDRDTVHLVECSSLMNLGECPVFGHKEGYSLELLKDLQIDGFSAQDFAVDKVNGSHSFSNVLGLLGVVYIAGYIFFAAVFSSMLKSDRSTRNKILRKALPMGLSGTASLGTAIFLKVRNENHFDKDIYNYVGYNIDQLDLQQVEEAESIFISVAKVERGPGGERDYKKNVKKVRNALSHLLKGAKI